MSSDGTHTCPRYPCPIRVPDSKMACVFHWNQLSSFTKVRIYATANRPILDPARRAALKMAQKEWAAARTAAQ